MNSTTPATDHRTNPLTRPAMPEHFPIVAHPGTCGVRHDPPCGTTIGAPYRMAERLRNGSTICHLCGQSFRRGDPLICPYRSLAELTDDARLRDGAA